MLTFLFALASIWTIFWFIMLLLDWGKNTPLTGSDAQRSIYADAAAAGSGSAKSATYNDTAKDKNNHAGATAGNDSEATKPAPQDKSASAETKPDAVVKQDQANVKPLFEKPAETDDLKVIKGIGVVMEQTLNDLGITTFKQLADFKQAEIKMVSDVLSEQNAGFGDRIERDEWVEQAKALV